ncbi:thymidine kinase [Clostridium tarantellae]|uniref:Thymidine kinase n=1 Tax=Clostridium tarantellae TaxID=39493 RepID=A0A6I1MGM3_9CLOT|nr:thymidine kinase [Clostridium tarantellae]MPQ42525.1 thymidine kinase [Clostridium tarantellae]
MSKLYFRYGAMNSGKSTHLMQVAYNYEERGMKAIIIKPATDKKGGTKVVSRLGVEKEVDLLIEKEDNIMEMIEEFSKQSLKIHCVIVDEVQFLKSHHIDELFEIAVNKDIPVICYGLRTDFQMNGFEGSERLLLLAHSIEEMKTICTCGRKAILNGRKVNGKYIFQGEQVAIDLVDNVEYQSLCGQCYFKYKENN